jgi:ABC-2 type transport system permease protein
MNRRRGFIGHFLTQVRRLRADGSQRILLLGIAPLICWLFCALYGDGTVKDLPIGICDQDHSALSRTLIRAIDATKLMRIVSNDASPEDLASGIRSGALCAGFYFPQGMEAAIKAGKQTRAVVFRNGTNYLISSFIGRESQTVVRTINAGLVLARLRKNGVPAKNGLALVSPLAVDVSNVYNPSFNYLNFLCPGVVFAQFGLIVMISGALCFAREKRRAVFRFRAQIEFAGLCAKISLYAIIIIALTSCILFALFPWYGVTTLHDSVMAVPSIALFLAACWWMGSFIGILLGQAALASEVCIFIGMPAFIFSGWTFPLRAAPPFMAVIAHGLPFTYFMHAWFQTAGMGRGALSPIPELIVLLSIALACMAGVFGLFILYQGHRRGRFLGISYARILGTPPAEAIHE